MILQQITISPVSWNDLISALKMAIQAVRVVANIIVLVPRDIVLPGEATMIVIGVMKGIHRIDTDNLTLALDIKADTRDDVSGR